MVSLPVLGQYRLIATVVIARIIIGPNTIRKIPLDPFAVWRPGARSAQMERRSRPRVAVDVDEVLCEFASMIVRWHNRVYGGVGPHKAMLCVGDFVSCALQC